MEFYSKDIEVDVHDVDFNGVCRASALMRYIQTAAQCQLTEANLSYDALKEQKRAFILARMKIEFTDTVRAYDRLNAVTFPCESRGFKFVRCYKLVRDGVTVARAVAVWALVDTETHRLVRASEFNLPLETYEPLDLYLDYFTMPSNMEAAGRYAVTYGIVDQNLHMNNTAYPDMYSNFLPLENKRISEITINFNKEAVAGDLLKVYRSNIDGVYYFRTLRSDGAINSEAEIRLADI